MTTSAFGSWIPTRLGGRTSRRMTAQGGRAIQVPHTVLRRLYSTAPWCHWQFTKSVKMQDFAELSRAGPLLGCPLEIEVVFTDRLESGLFQAWNIQIVVFHPNSAPTQP